MEHRLAIIDLAGLSQRHRYVLIKKRRIVGWRGDVSAAGKNLPRSGAKKALARRGGKGVGEASAGHACLRRNQAGKKRSMRLQTFHGPLLPRQNVRGSARSGPVRAVFAWMGRDWRTLQRTSHIW